MKAAKNPACLSSWDGDWWSSNNWESSTYTSFQGGQRSCPPCFVAAFRGLETAFKIKEGIFGGVLNAVLAVRPWPSLALGF